MAPEQVDRGVEEVVDTPDGPVDIPLPEADDVLGAPAAEEDLLAGD